MTVSSINFQKRVYQNALKHDERKGKKEPSYLLKKEFRKENEFRKYFNVAERFSAVKKIFSKRKGKHPTFENSYLEAVVNLEEHHTLKDVEKLRKVISDTLGFQVSEIAIHRDEGYVSSDGKVMYNYHAHIGCFTLDANGKQLNRQPKAMHFKLQKLQTEVAEVLGMQRGQENSKATRLDHKQYREKAKELARAEQKHNQELASAKVAVLEQVQPVLQKSVEDKKQLNGTVKQLQADIEAEREKTAYWKSLYDQAPVKTQKDLDNLKSDIRKQMISEGGFTAQDYRALSKFIKDYKTAFKLGEAITVPEVINNIYQRLNKPKEVVKEVIKTVEKIVEKPIQVEVPVETVKEIIVPRQLTASDIEKLPRVQELNNRLKKQSEELECAQGRISYLEQAYNQTLDNYSVLQNDYNELVTDYRKLDTAYNKLNTEYNLLTRSKTNDDTSECSRVRIDTENQSENILQAYARTIGYSKSEPEQTDELHGTEEPTQTTSPLRSTKGFHR